MHTPCKEARENRKRLVAEVNSIIFLMRQVLALRKGKDEANDNLHQLLARSGVVEAESVYINVCI